MAANVRSLLLQLHTNLQEKNDDSDLKATDLVRDICNASLEASDSLEFDHICAIVFDPVFGIVEFLKQSATVENFKNAKFEALDFLNKFIDKAKVHALPSVVALKDVCLQIFTWDKAAKTRSSTFPVLIKVMQIAAASLPTEDMNVTSMTDRLFNSLSTPYKLPPTVRQGIYHVLGIITQTFPEHMDIYAPRLVDVYLGALKQQMTSKTKAPEMPIVAGCLYGLDGVLTSFPNVLEENRDNCKAVFNYAYMGINPNSNLSRYEVPRAALNLFAKHCHLFRHFIYTEYRDVYQRLHSWSLHNNKETKTIAWSAVECFLREVTEILSTKGKDDTGAKTAFVFFLGTFQSVFKNFTSDVFARDVSVAIKGFGYLARPCKIYLNADEIVVMFQEVLQRCENYYNGQTHLEDKILFLPSFLESLASIAAEVDKISECQIQSLQNLTVLLVENYPIVPASIRFTCYHAIARLLFSLFSKGKYFKMLISHIAYHGVLRSCSHPVPNSEENTKEWSIGRDPRRITYKDYLDLWNNLMNIVSLKINVDQFSVTLGDRHAIVRNLYEEIVKAVLVIVNKLDLSSTREDTFSVNGLSDPVVGLQASKPKDFQIFFNVVEFGRELLLRNHVKFFQPWVFTFSKDIIRLSTKFPLVSGLYKLFAVCLTICRETKYFKDVLSESGQMESDQREETLICYSLFVKYTLEVIVRMKQFKDDLLVSCLSVVLALPKEIVIPHIQTIIPALQVAFKVGLSYLPLAVDGVHTLERWSKELPHDLIEPYYSHLLPILNSYLKTYGDGVTRDWNAKDGTLQLVGKKSSRGPKRLTVKKLNAASRTTESTALTEVKLKILALLGKLGGSVNRCVIVAERDLMSEKAVAWDMEKSLKFSVPFADMKPTIYLDKFLPQVVELCFSSERQTKVSACELLHASVLFTLGTKVQWPAKKSSSPLANLHKHIFPALLRLACDIDEISKQLFHPLVFQLIHWFTSKKMFGSEETLILLDSVLDGVCNSTDSSLRDFCADCIKEYMIWSIKQTSVKQQEKHPYNVSALIKRLCSLCLHPSPWCRLGTCLAFNQCYTVLREEDSLVGSFVLELLVHFVDCLSVAHKDDKALGTQEQSKQALNHIERILVTKHALLKGKNSERKIPRGWKDGTLEEAVDWLLIQCGRPQTEARHKCMELFFRLTPLLADGTTAEEYFRKLIAENGSRLVISRFEGGGLSESTGPSLKNSPTLHDVDKFNIESALFWFDLILAALDCYVWALGQGLLKLENIADGGDNALFKSVEYFVRSVSTRHVFELATSTRGGEADDEVFSPLEIETYNRRKCTVTIRLMNLLQVMLQTCGNSSDHVVLGRFFEIPVWDLVVMCVLNPAAVGFDIADLEIMEKLPNEIEHLLTTMKAKLPSNEHWKFVDTLKRLTDADEKMNLLRGLSVGFDDCALNTGLLVDGYEKLHHAGYLEEIMRKDQLLPERLLTVFVDIAFRERLDHFEEKTVSPSIQILGKRILLLAFSLKLKVDALVSLLLDTTPVSCISRKSANNKGMVIYLLFEEIINECLAKSAEETVEVLVDKKSNVTASAISSILIGMLKYLSNKDTTQRYGDLVTTAILLNWNNLKSIWFADCTEESQEWALTILTKIMIVGSKILSDCNHVAFKSVFSCYLDMLKSRKTKLPFKARLFDLLPWFSILPAEGINELHMSLTEVVANNFPMKSSEVEKSSANRAEFVSAFLKLLKAFEISGNMALLKLIVSMTCNEQRHVCEAEINTSLKKFMKCLPVEKHGDAVRTTFDMFYEDNDCSPQFKREIMKRICLPLLHHANKVSVVRFYEMNIVKIMNTLQSKQSKVNQEKLEAQLVLKTGCFLLMEVVYLRLGKDELYANGAAIVNAFCEGKMATGKELTQEITKLAHNAKKENMQGETVLLELRRELHCAAFNVLVAVISCTQTEEKFYTAFLFSDNIKKGDFLWENIIDVKKALHFEMELMSPLERKKQFVAIRHEARRRETADDDEELGNSLTSVHYLTSQYLADSSLSEDVGKFDFSSSAQMSPSGASDRSELAVASKSKEIVALEREEIVDVELDVLNEHECMSTITSVCMHLVKSGISKISQKDGAQWVMPTWMSALLKKFSDADANIRLFIAKIVVNCNEIFTPYAKEWLYPMMQLIVSEVAGLEINYFVADVVATILSWSAVAIPEDDMMSRGMASKLLEFLMQAAHYPRKDILRNNLEIVRTVVEVWKARLDIPIRSIYENLKDVDTNSRSNAVGLQLLAVVLANNLPPFSPTTGINQKSFLEAVAANLLFKYRDVHGVAAEVIGMILKYMLEKENVSESEFHDCVAKKLQDLSSQKKHDQFLFCLSKIHIYHSNIVDKFLSRVLFLLPSAQGVNRAYCLKLILSCVEKIDGPYTELKSRGLDQLLMHRESDVQLLSLKILKGIMGKLKPSELFHFLQSVANASTRRNADCKFVVYEICIWICNNYSDERDVESEKIRAFAKETMIRGLVDEEVPLRMMVFNFWSQETRLPLGTIDRMLSLMRDLYSPSVKHKFLSYCTFLMLEMTSRSPDYSRKLFEHSLQECKFEDYRVNASWRARHRSMMPLFLNTITSQVDAGENDTDTEDDVRATQDGAKFTPTQANLGTQSNWMTPGTVGDFTTLSQSAEMSQSSLLFSVGKKLPSPFKSRKNLKTGKAADAATGSAESTDSNEGEDYRRLRRRFLKDKGATRIYFIKRELQKKKRHEEMIEAQRVKREAQVTIYRSYRKGDLPDIEITYSAIIAPIQALAQKDENFARTLFTSLVSGILQETPADEVREIRTNLSESFGDIIRKTTQYNPAMIGSVLDVWYLEYEDLKIDSEDLVTAATMSKQQNTAILLLEKIISRDELSANARLSTKRARLERAPQPQSAKCWIKMAELYKSIHDYDSIGGIFAHKLNSHEETRMALEAEREGNFSSALNLYEKVYCREDWADGNPEQCEMDMWDDAIMQCYNNLTQWDKLEQHSLANVENKDLNAIWDDIYQQEHYLPFVIRSKVKRTLEGHADSALWPFVDATLDKAHPERNEFLQARYSPDIALLCVAREDYSRAAHYYNTSMENFMREWATAPLTCDVLRQSLLRDLQKLAEMKEFLDAIASASFGRGDLAKYVSRWERRMPDELDSVDTWDDIVCSRSLYLRKLANLAELTEESSGNENCGLEIGKICLEGNFHSKLKYVDSICQQGNTAVALKHLRETRKESKVLNKKICDVKFTQSYFRVQLKIAENQSAVPSFRTLLNAWDQLDKEDPGDLLTLSITQHGLHSEAAKHIISTLREHDAVLTLLPESESRALLRRLNCDSLRPRDVIQSASEMCFKHLNEAVAKQAEEHCGNDVECLATAHLNLAMFCDSCISSENSEFQDSDTRLKFPKIVIENHLQAMKLGSRDACMLFPKLLPILEGVPETSSAFQSKVFEVPTWMFLRWIGQLAALLDKTQSTIISDLLFAITKDYPQAVIYPFTISSKSYSFSDDRDRKNCRAVEKIKCLLSEQHLARKFVAALDLFKDPIATLKDFKRSLSALVKKKDGSFEKELMKIYHEVFSCVLDNSQENEVPFGEFHIKFAKENINEMEKVCGRKCCKAASLKAEDVNKLLQSITDKMSKESCPTLLRYYSPWLSDFNSAKFGSELEIPGQYTGLKKPLPEYHIKIAGFDENVLVMQSMRRPKRIKIRGNDEKEYKYLVKSGEDLRLDQRIEQLFTIMNEVYSKHAACSTLRLQLVTYQVIPLTDNVGILEWVDDTIPLHDFIEKSKTDNDKRVINKVGPRWLEIVGGPQCPSYDVLYTKPRNDVVRRFDEVVATIRKDILRQSFWSLSSSAEAYFTLRSHFVRSYAVLSVSQYILGIGDRHLKNVMICMKTGVAVGIDFGYSFGIATQFLPIPELMPFRLTPQILNLMEPMRENGLFRATMIHVLQALRANHDLFKSVMDIFVKEPSLDWQAFARVQVSSLGMSETEDWSWFPKEKLNIALRKLRGDNPAYIMRDELEQSVHKKKKCFNDMLTVCMGDKKHNIRAKNEEAKLSVDSQVSSLIDHATDSNVLGRTFIGWSSYL